MPTGFCQAGGHRGDLLVEIIGAAGGQHHRRARRQPRRQLEPDLAASTDDHKRHTTPAEAIRLGADYLVVGRPILKDSDPREAARQIIAEIDDALAGGTGRDAPSVNANTV